MYRATDVQNLRERGTLQPKLRASFASTAKIKKRYSLSCGLKAGTEEKARRIRTNIVFIQHPRQFISMESLLVRDLPLSEDLYENQSDMDPMPLPPPSSIYLPADIPFRKYLGIAHAIFTSRFSMSIRTVV